MNKPMTLNSRPENIFAPNLQSLILESPRVNQTVHKWSVDYKTSYCRKFARETIIVLEGEIILNNNLLKRGDKVSVEANCLISIAIEKEATVLVATDGCAEEHNVFYLPMRQITWVSELPVVTVIVTAYNVQNFITSTLLSILNQDYPNIEILVVEDASTDKTLEVVKDFARQYSCITVLENPVNQGAALSKQRGVLAASGEFFLVYDGDDLLGKNAISQCMLAANTTQADTIIFGFVDLDSHTGIYHNPSFPIKVSGMPYIFDLPENMNADRLSRLTHLAATCLLKTSVHKQVFAKAFYAIPYFEDFPTFIAMLATARRVSIVNELYHGYRHGRSDQAINAWATRLRGVKSACFITSVEKMLAETWARPKLIRRLILFKLVRIAAIECFTMQKAGNRHEFRLTVKFFKKSLEMFSIHELFFTLRPRFLCLTFLLRFGNPSLIKKTLGKKRLWFLK
jgi:glycosyltransferase involved in cell wall biosynthesis